MADNALPEWATGFRRSNARAARRFVNATVMKTVWPDRNAMVELGIEAPVLDMLNRMGLPGLVDFRYPTYKEPTIQFMSTVRLVDSTDCEAGAGAYSIKFKVNHVSHQVTIEELSGVLGFPNDMGSRPDNIEAAKALWRDMTDEHYRGDEARSGKIRNPVVRYVARAIGNTLFARKDPGKSKINELCLLHRGLPPSVTGPVDDDHAFANNAYLFIDEILAYKAFIMQDPRRDPTLRFGGMLVPLFEYVGVDLSQYTPLDGASTMDIASLAQAKWGKALRPGAFIYKWSVGTSDFQCLLPLPGYTTPDTVERLRFEVPEHLHYRPMNLRRGRRSVDRAREPTPETQISDEEMPPEPERLDDDMIASPPPPETDEARAWRSYSDSRHRRAEREIGYLRRMTGWLARQNVRAQTAIRRMREDIQRMGCTTTADVYRPAPVFETGGSSGARERRSPTPAEGSDGPRPARRSRRGRSPVERESSVDVYVDMDGNIL